MIRIKSSILILINMVFISGCSLTLGIIAASYDKPTSLAVTIDSDPSGAEVFLNGKKLGTAPLKLTIEGLSKEHRIVFIKSGYKTKIERVSISPGPQLKEKHLTVIHPDGSSVQVVANTLNVILETDKTDPASITTIPGLTPSPASLFLNPLPDNAE